MWFFFEFDRLSQVAQRLSLGVVQGSVTRYLTDTHACIDNLATAARW